MEAQRPDGDIVEGDTRPDFATFHVLTGRFYLTPTANRRASRTDTKKRRPSDGVLKVSVCSLSGERERFGLQSEPLVIALLLHEADLLHIGILG
jgi:hypothetical protein